MDVKEQMQDIAKSVKSQIPEGFCFFVLVMPANNPDGRANYVSNGRREDIIKAMKEFIIRAGKYEDSWMKHLDI